MTVNELIEKLKKCSPYAIACVEAWENPEIEEVKEYTNGSINFVYVGDDLENITYELTEENDFEEI
jgi:hypothetical protein